MDATLVCTPSFGAGGEIEFHSADLDLLQEIQRSHPAFKGALFVIEDGKFAGVA
ncbi:hypothetical protein KK141_05805 [Dyella sp. LX-66]|uniref:hypothetical protein n=1 Tax=unclassified Dyella TaxID=2634549 RepID=UPI001BDFEE0A|nr:MULTISPECIES: hypothetical protein [unclassified Dyella]MBT2116779.1 hypothetical protein [Dyella sp. LX-1]MBT2139041.1 hypothetical protein [Dyella sp. LX-66]